jgi:signal transduction histidine kinase
VSERADPELEAAHQAAAGTIASGVSVELIAPLREVRDGLAVALETLDHHFREAKGPTPLPFPEAKALRERLAEIYVVAREVTRQTADLARAIAAPRASAEPVDLNQVVEQAVALARHELGAIELYVDAGELPLVRAAPGELVLLVARLLAVGAAAARAGAGELAIESARRPGEHGEEAVVSVRHDGGEVVDLAALARRTLAPLGGRFRAFADGAGVVYELVVPLR